MVGLFNKNEKVCVKTVPDKKSGPSILSYFCGDCDDKTKCCSVEGIKKSCMCPKTWCKCGIKLCILAALFKYCIKPRIMDDKKHITVKAKSNH